ncbi:hypothetical protein C8F04DRAFT_1269856 [Mycena alexandri]|uniref:Uncharacterized protein n=1 Tax=Mycena alexandri TaxID=1745969 RepID=A0AAD6SEZ4_9AGAR|nr:hypothetical protein C8F04DRAFT_1269856 [Mycena alexandri]
MEPFSLPHRARETSVVWPDSQRFGASNSCSPYYVFSSFGHAAHHEAGNLRREFAQMHDPYDRHNTDPRYVADLARLQGRLASLYAIVGIQEIIQDRALLAARASVEAVMELMTNDFVGAWGPYFSPRSAENRRRRLAREAQRRANAAQAAQAQLTDVWVGHTITIGDLPDIPISELGLLDEDNDNAVGWVSPGWGDGGGGAWTNSGGGNHGWGDVGGGWGNGNGWAGWSHQWDHFPPLVPREPIRFESMRPWRPLRLFRPGRAYALALEGHHPGLSGMPNPLLLLRALRRRRQRRERRRRRALRAHLCWRADLLRKLE